MNSLVAALQSHWSILWRDSGSEALQMARKYIQPVLHKVRVVLRDGRSVMMSSVLKREAPWVTQIVSSPLPLPTKAPNVPSCR